MAHAHVTDYATGEPCPWDDETTGIRVWVYAVYTTDYRRYLWVDKDAFPEASIENIIAAMEGCATDHSLTLRTNDVDGQLLIYNRARTVVKSWGPIHQPGWFGNAYDCWPITEALDEGYVSFTTEWDA